MEGLFANLGTYMAPIMDLGALFMIFIVFTIIGLLVGLGILNAIRNGLMIAVGFNGVYIIVDFFLAKIGPAATALTERFGGVFTYTDVGWGAFAAFAWGHPVAYVVVVISIIVNLVMIALNLTDTVNLNVWDLWEAIISAMIVIALTGNWAAGIIVATGWCWISLMLADFYANKGYPEKVFGFPNIALYQGVNDIWGVFGYWMSLLLDKLPLTANNKFTPDYVQEKLGIIGEPAVLGGIIGLLMGIGAGFWWGDIVMLMIHLATGLVLLPMMSGIVMQALVPVTEAASAFLEKRTGGKELFIGVDCAIAVGNTTVLAVTALMIPFMILFAFIIPGVVAVPLADLPCLLFFWVYIVGANNADMIRSFIGCLVAGVIVTVIGIWVAPWSALVAEMQGVEGVTGATCTFNYFCPDMLVSGILGENFGTLGVVGVAAVMIVLCGIGTAFRIRYNKNRKAAIAAAAAE